MVWYIGIYSSLWKRALVKCDPNLGQTSLSIVIFEITYIEKYRFQIFYRVELLI